MASLTDFINSIKTDDSIVYSTPPTPSIRVIPPEEVKVIPPEKVKPPIIKLKIVQKQVAVPSEQPVSPSYQTPVEQPIVQNAQTPQTVQNAQPIQPVVQTVQTPQPTVQPTYVQPQPQPIVQPVVQNVQTVPQQAETRVPTDEELFNSTGTEYSKRDLWFQRYQEAKASRKNNPIVERMKKGRFTITPDNKVLLLPDYDVVGKDPDDILRDKWF